MSPINKAALSKLYRTTVFIRIYVHIRDINQPIFFKYSVFCSGLDWNYSLIMCVYSAFLKVEYTKTKFIL